MRSYGEPFRNKKITLLGLGLLGRGVGDAEFLAECGADVLVTDKKTEAELSEPVARLKKYPNITFHFGGHRTEDFTNCDLVVKAAGVPLDSPEIAAARAAGIPIAMSTALFAKYASAAGAKIVGVTGTRGKSTVSHMIYHCLNEAQQHLDLNRAHGTVGRTIRPRRIVLGGNVRGISTLAMLPEIEAGDIAVLELDSWQLQGFGDLQISPHVAVFTNLMPDHQNYYRNEDEYFADKANIFRFQKAGDTLVIGRSMEKRIGEAHPLSEVVVPGALPADWELRIPGDHNRENATLAASALLALGLTSDTIRTGLRSFEGVEGRLQLVRDMSGVHIYNDNNATTPEATIAALRALDTGRKDIVLIAGGSDKGLELDELAAEIKRTVASVILLMHPDYKGSERLKEALTVAGVGFAEAADLSDAVSLAREKTRTGTLLFSPAFASFGMFKNEYERNDRFLEIVGHLS